MSKLGAVLRLVGVVALFGLFIEVVNGSGWAAIAFMVFFPILCETMAYSNDQLEIRMAVDDVIRSSQVVEQ
jgi:hypothetical protein